jgi:hypothetical protein
MKTPLCSISLMMALLAALLSLPQLVHGASPDEQAKFLAAAKQAFEKHNSDALAALTYWGRVSDKLKERGKKRYAQEVALTVTDVALSAPDPKSPDLEWKDEAGIAHRSNLPVTKHLKITFAPGSSIQLKRGTVKVRDVTYPVGEKDGKLYLLQPAPVK